MQDDKTAFKIKLKEYCQDMIERRIQAGRDAIDNAQQAANQEEKSSAGDKYETSRAMSHLEKDMHGRQLAANITELSVLLAINAREIYTKARPGAFIKCENFNFFIAAGLGKQTLEGEIIFFLSPNAPLAKLLEGKSAGDHISFNGKENLIISVC